MLTRSFIPGTRTKLFSLLLSVVFFFTLLSIAPQSGQAAQKTKLSKPGTTKVAPAKKRTTVKKSTKRYSKKRRVARTRKEMILEVEMKALKEALSIKKDQENTSKFVTRAEKEHTKAKSSANQAREMLGAASGEVTTISAAKTAVLAIIAKVKTVADEVQALAQSAKTESKLAGIEATTFQEMRLESKKEVTTAEAREATALKVLERSRQKETYYRSLVKRRIRNAEDFFYIAEAAMKKGGNAQAMEFAIKAKAEMEQAKIADNEADIRAEAVVASEKVLEARKEATATARLKSKTFAILLKLTEEISISLKEASEAARLSAAAAQKVVARASSFAASKDEVLTFANKKVASLAAVKDAAERKETLTGEAALAAQAVLVANQKAQAHAEARAQAALSEARTMVVKPTPVVPVQQQLGQQPVQPGKTK